MIIKNSQWKKLRDDLSNYPKAVEHQGVLNYLVETFSTDASESADLALPDHYIGIPDFYSDEIIRTIIHKLTHCSEHDIKIIPCDNDFKTVNF